MSCCVRSALAAVSVAALLTGSAAFAGLPEYQASVRSEASLVSYYTFDADAGSVADTAAGGHNGTLQGTAAFTSASDALGAVGKSLSLDGASWVSFGVVDAFNFYDGAAGASLPGTVEMWIRPGANAGTFGSNPALAAARSGGYDLTRYSMHLDNWRNGLGVFAGGAGYHQFSYPFGADQWYHVAFTVYQPAGASAPYVKVYTNGIQTGGFWGFGGGLGQPFQIGSSSPTGTELFKGKVDEVAIYSETLTEGQIATHYEAMNGMGLDAPTTPLAILAGYEDAVQAEPSLLSFYSFEGDSTAVADKKGAVNGTLVGPTSWTSGFAGGQALGLGLSGLGHAAMGSVPAFAFADGTGTIEAWVSPSSILKYRDPDAGRLAIMSCADIFDYTYYGMEMRSSDKSVGIESSVEGYVPTPVADLLGTSKWYHLAAVFNAGKMDYYVNGRPVMSKETLTLVPPDAFLSSFQIGAVDPQGDWGFKGKIDEVAIYGAALSEAQIAAHYAGAAMTFTLHDHTFVNPGSMAPVSVTLAPPVGQTAPSGLKLTFSFDPAIISVSIPSLGLTLSPGVAYPIPTGTGSTALTVTPVSGAYGTSTLTVTANPESGWDYSDSATFNTILAGQGLIIVNDHFDDGNLGTNAGGSGGGFWQFYNGKAASETNSNWVVAADGGWFSSRGIYNKPMGNFKFMNPQGIRIEWLISNINVTADGFSGFLGGELADCRHELGIVSANRSNATDSGSHQVFHNTDGGFYVNIFYQANSFPSQNVTVTGDIRVSNSTHPNFSDGDGTGLATVATFTLPNVTSVTPAQPLVVTIEADQTGWKVGCSPSAGAVFTPLTTGVSVQADSKVGGGWNATSLGKGVITNEFKNGGFLWAMFQDLNNGNGTGSIDSVKACVGCTLSTDCPYPFADADRDGDVDQVDFSVYQLCYTGPDAAMSSDCRCFDRNTDGRITSVDFDAFLKCALTSGPNVPVDKTCGN